MGSSLAVRRASGYASGLLLSCITVLACSSPSDPTDSQTNVAGVAGQVVSSAGAGGAPSSSGGSGAAGATAVSGSGGAVAVGGSLNDTAGAGGSQAGTGGTPAAGAHAGGAGNGGASGNGTAGGGGSNAAVCQTVKTEYASELEKQLACKPGAASQCTNKVAAAPGCECRVFIQPADPFAIEHLSNVGNGWFDADCSMAVCPAKCSTAVAGTCQADAKSPLGGRCMTP